MRGPSERILVLGLAKSGTTYLWTVIRNALSDPTLYFENRLVARGSPGLVLEKFLSGSLHPGKPGYWHGVGTLPDGRQVLEALRQAFSKRILIVRDPRDVILSQFFWIHSRKMMSPGVFEASWSRIRRKEADPGGHAFRDLIEALPEKLRRLLHEEMVEKLESQRALIDKGDWFVVSYEELRSGGKKGLEVYLGRSLDLDVSLDPRHRYVERQKRSHAWREWFTAEDAAFYNTLLGRYLDFYGYGADYRLESPTRIPSEFGSDYVRRLFQVPSS